ncbi:hypothetical protein PybrP1_002954 [[Pythium] brassicae (nom. inval.)]|nr:hypothetical protein PybrP1_002954 [[Pythium] brassicae (nom. inval.)]
MDVDALLVPELKLRSTSGTNAKQLERRLSYLWQSAHTLLPSNAAMAHQLTASAMQLVRAHGLELPHAVLDFICERCGALLVPSVSADRVSCRRCSHANVRCGASTVVKPKAKKRPAEASGDAGDTGGKRAKTASATATDGEQLKLPVHDAASHASGRPATTGDDAPAARQPLSMFAAPPSPPRKLLDGPKKKKKKKTNAPAVAAVKSSLSSFLQSFGAGSSK